MQRPSMLARPFASRCLVAVALSSALWLGGLVPSPAVAQQTLADCGLHYAQLFSEDDVAALASATAISDEQRDAARMLLRSGLERAMQLGAKRDRECRSLVNWSELPAERDEGYKKAYQAMLGKWYKFNSETVAGLLTIERETLVDVRSVLTPAQIEAGWSVFEKVRRRSLIDQNGGPWGMGTGPRALIKALKLEGVETSAAEPVLLSYDDRLDTLIVRRMCALQRITKNFLQTGNYDMTVFRQTDMGDDEIRKLNVKAAAELRAVLGEKSRDRLDRVRAGTEAQEPIQPPSRDGTIQQMMRIETLTSDQRSRMKSLVAEADRKTLSEALAQLRDRDQLVLKGKDHPGYGVAMLAAESDEEGDNPSPSPAVRAAVARMAEQRKEQQRRLTAISTTLIKDLRGVLTPTQIEVLEGLGEDGEAVISSEAAFKSGRGGGVPNSIWVDDKEK